jgi:hypothetical protein
MTPMNAFAKPEDASPYEYPEFPAPARQKLDLSFSEGPEASKFTDFETSHNQAQDTSLPVVQMADLQDFKKVLSYDPS